ncbi:MAG: hypothetical protein ACOZBZ_01460 [Patescibacteria group bacterium]
MSDVIPGLKLIYQTGGTNIADDPSMPYRLDANFRPPEFMEVAFVLMHGGSEEIVVRGMTREALEEFVEANDFKTHPRLRRLTITGPDGEVIEVKK